MARRRTYREAARTQAITVRITPAEHARLAAEAAQAGVSIAGLAERYITRGTLKIESSGPAPLQPAALAELKRIANALHAIAGTAPAHLPAKAESVAATMRDLLQLLVRDELLSQRITALRTRITANDSAPASARQEFQRVMHLRAARPESENP